MRVPFHLNRLGRLTVIIASVAGLAACASTGTTALGVSGSPGAETVPVQAAAVAPPSTLMQLGEASFAPHGYLEFCERRPDQCGLATPTSEAERADLHKRLMQDQWANLLAPSSPSQVAMGDEPASAADPSPAPAAAAADPATNRPTLHLTPELWSQLVSVNREVNQAIRPMADTQAFGRDDYWTLPLTEGRPVGNCKHYVLEKRKALAEAGVPASAMAIAIVQTRWGDVHAVLVIDTDGGSYVLDNLTSRIQPWTRVDYTWIERQAPGDPLRWVALASVSASHPRG